VQDRWPVGSGSGGLVRLGSVDVPFEDFVVARGPALVRFAHGLSGDRHLAEDLVQEVLARVAERWSRLERPEAYLRAALCRELVSWRRRRSHGERPGEVPDRVGPGSADGVVERDAVWRLLATLQARQRAVLVLRYWEGLPDREIAGLLGCSEGTVRSSAARAFAVLRAQPDLAQLMTGGALQ
jgi:RNA polymerase sigma-70 factor (sigma-E family)